MENPDILSNVISAIAVLLSLGALYMTQRNSAYERKRTLRGQLSDALERIIATQLENAKLYEEAANKNPMYYQAVSSSLNQQHAFQLNLAMYLAEQIPELVTAVEHNTLAYSSAWSGDLLTAEKYYVKAIEVSPSDFHRALAIRSYAGFLFPQRRFEEARDRYRESINLIKGGDDHARSTNGFTYQMWAVNELNIANAQTRATELFESARNEYMGIENKVVRNNNLQGLEAARAAVVQQMAQPTPPFGINTNPATATGTFPSPFDPPTTPGQGT